MSELKLRLQSDMKTAMKAGEKDRLGVIRLILAAIKQREVDERIELDDAAVLAVLDKMVKQRRESVSQYEAANREDLAAVERAEITVIQAYLPVPLSDQEIEAYIRRRTPQVAGPELVVSPAHIEGVRKESLPRARQLLEDAEQLAQTHCRLHPATTPITVGATQDHTVGFDDRHFQSLIDGVIRSEGA